MIKDIETIKDKIFYYDRELEKTSISGVSEEQLETCLKTIIESNPNVTFNTIQYSRLNRRLYLYTDKNIDISKWKGNKRPSSPVLISVTDVLEEIKKVLLDEKKQENSCISIYDSDTVIPLYEVAKIVREKEKSYKRMSEDYETRIKDAFKYKVGDSAFLYLGDFDYDTNELKIGFTHYSLGNYTYCYFKKKDGDLIGRRESGYYDMDELLVSSGSIISEAYDKFLEYKDYKTQRSWRIRPVNSKFLIDIDRYGVQINTNTMTNVFSLHYRSYTDEYKYECNSNNVIEVLNGKEDELAKRILVRIDECPEWMHGILYDKRIKELQDKKEQEEKRRQEELKEQERLQKQEEKKQKRIGFRRRFLPFLEKKN